MSLIKCPECGKEISNQAPACPGCGIPISKKPQINEWHPDGLVEPKPLETISKPINDPVMGVLKGAFFFIAFIFFAWLIGHLACGWFFNDSSTKTDTPTKTEETKTQLSDSEKERLRIFSSTAVSKKWIRLMDVNNHEVRVDPIFWEAINSVQKESFALNMALYCSFNSDSKLVWVEIYDFQSGKKLAYYGAWGYKVY